MHKNLKVQEQQQRIAQYFRETREQILLQQKSQQTTQPTSKLIMLNINDDYYLPGYFHRIKEFIENGEIARDKNNESDDLDSNFNNDYRLPNNFFDRVVKELEPRANDKENQKSFWKNIAKEYDIDPNDYENIDRLIEDQYQLKLEKLSLDENPVDETPFINEDQDLKLIKSEKFRKMSEMQHEENEQKDQEGNENKSKEFDSNDSGYDSEREELKNKIEQEQLEKELALQRYLNDEQIQELLDIDSDEDIIFNEKDQVYFTDINKSPFDDLNKIYERRESLHQDKINFQKQFQKVIINAYKEKLKKKLYSRLKQKDQDDNDDDDLEESFTWKRRESQRSQKDAQQQQKNQKKDDEVQKQPTLRGSFGIDQKKQKDIQKKQSIDQNASTIANKQRASKEANIFENNQRKSIHQDKVIADKLVGLQQSVNLEPIKQVHPNLFDLDQSHYSQQEFMQNTFGQINNNNRQQNQQSDMKQNKSRALIDLLREELQKEDGYISDELMEGKNRSYSPIQKDETQLKKLNNYFGDLSKKKEESHLQVEQTTNYFYSKYQQEYKLEKKKNFIENLKDTLIPKQNDKQLEDKDLKEYEDDLYLQKRKQDKEKRKAALEKSQQLQMQRQKQMQVAEISEINQKIYGCEDRITQLGLKNSPQKNQKSQIVQEVQYSQTQSQSKQQIQRNMQGQQMVQQSSGSFKYQQNGINSANGLQMGQQQSNLAGSAFNQNKKGSQTSFPIDLQKLQSMNTQQAYQQQQQLYSYLDKKSSQQDSRMQSQQVFNQNQMQMQQQQQQQQQLISPESSFIQNSFMQQLPFENINTARSNYSQFLYSARQDPNQQQSGAASKHDLDSAEQQQFERACMLLYSDLKKVLQILLKDAQKNQDFSQINLLFQYQQELEEIMSFKNNITYNFLFMKLKIFRDEKKLKDHIEKMSFYQL
ncbi:hypothetical protein TTHERM_00462980 (macronuclear) [Tetrahymena thermophila SB210]|uniref:Uncharacterized protein n=1 Tax=Tetrahymena thermophila (strain SB210) TaxID=312017 RepID=Q23PY5_TETTS|nr:hypothetical protein TTHERM_00462980 [Tetrahymena thermophila SB210]EAR98550.3 hypothetical protein TTHERM_00462980 [Tetrahymena thermophila SB210]|eukprot:XP_001018795.3 hypothetical protein TTHERM_00462980 [Tetrahymena thermophila SB210]